MTYNPAIPQSFNIPSQSQAQFLTNYSQLNSVFDIDHVTFNDATVANRGKHDKSTYVEITPDPVTVANEIAVYSKQSGTNVSELYYRREGNGIVGQLTIFKAWGIFNGNTGVLSDSFNITSVTRTAQGTYTVLFANPLPNANYAVLITPQMTPAFTVGGIPGVNSLLATQFQINIKSLTATVGADLNPVSFLVFQN